jgi:hypothetical protein
MKPLNKYKYIVGGLALIAVASFASPAKAQVTSAVSGDVMLGIYDTNDKALGSYEADLGAFSTLKNGETFNLGSTVSSTFSGDTSATLTFSIAASADGGGAAGGLSAAEVAFTSTGVTASTLASSNTAANNNIGNITGNFADSYLTLPSNTSSTGTSIGAGTDTSSNTDGFQTQVNASGGSYGLAAGAATLAAYPSNGTDFTFYTKQSSSQTTTADGFFVFGTNGSGQEILTYDVASTPEPSAYALGLCALALFWVLKRRSSVA